MATVPVALHRSVAGDEGAMRAESIVCDVPRVCVTAPPTPTSPLVSEPTPTVSLRKTRVAVPS